MSCIPSISSRAVYSCWSNPPTRFNNPQGFSSEIPLNPKLAHDFDDSEGAGTLLPHGAQDMVLTAAQCNLDWRSAVVLGRFQVHESMNPTHYISLAPQGKQSSRMCVRSGRRASAGDSASARVDACNRRHSGSVWWFGVSAVLGACGWEAFCLCSETYTGQRPGYSRFEGTRPSLRSVVTVEPLGQHGGFSLPCRVTTATETRKSVQARRTCATRMMCDLYASLFNCCRG